MTNRCIWPMCLGLLAVVSAACYAQKSDVLTLQQSVELALVNNRDIRKIYIQDRSQKIAADGAKNAYLPTVTVGGNYARLDSKNTVDIAGQTLVTNPQDSIMGGAVLTMPIDISGLIRNGVLIAKNNSKAARLALMREQNNLVLTVKEGYYQVLRNIASLAVAEEAVKNANDRLKTATALVDAGLSPRLDITRAEAAVAAAEQTRITAANAVDLSKAQLNNTIGRDVNTAFNIQPITDAVVPNTNYMAAVSEALSARPEVSIADVNVELAKRNILYARRSNLPTLGLNGSYQHNFNRGAFDDKPSSYTTTMTLSIPVFDAYAARDAAKQAELGVNTADIDRLDVQETIKLEVRQVMLIITEASQKVASAQKGSEQAAEALRVSRVRYEEGVADQIELSDAELLYTQAQLNLVNARFDLLSAVSRYDRAIGKNAGIQ